MFVVDTQIHIWKEETPDRPWVPGARERIRLNGHREDPFSYEEALELMDEAGVNRALILPPSWEGDRIDYALEACEAHPDRFGIMARIPQNKPEEGKAMLKDFAQNPHVKGTRLTFHRPQDRNWMIDGTNDWYWPIAEELRIPTMVHAPIWKRELGEIAARHPELKIIIDHMGIMARCVDDAIGYWASETADLHVHPNIYVKVSALPGYSTQPFPNNNIQKYVREMVDKMGPQRCFYGTDITRLLGHGITYTDTIEQFTKHWDFTPEELEWIMGRGISEVLNWPIEG
ncbi:amidohydrolase family protein [Streptomyces sp. NPDC001980]|uniref:amidohydrolase family protein n=1 Tax=Streptomyces sp. NPDC001980 TaxID=3157126 RepID=UPI00331B0716